MKNFFNHITQKLKSKLKIENIEIIDNSYLHKKHKFFDDEKFQLKLVIHSEELKKMEIVNANRVIYALLKEEMKNKIHALQIEIK